MYNFSISSPLKAWVDQIVRIGKTFGYSPTGPRGLLEMKKVIVITARGGAYEKGTATETFDFQVPYLRHILGFISLTYLMFNAAEDAPEQLRSFLLGRIEAVQEFHRNTLREIISGAKNLLVNYEKEQARESMAAAARRLTTWLDHNAVLSTVAENHVYDSLLDSVQAAHPRTVYAAVVREGEWHNLNYAHQLSHGARRIATHTVEPKLNGFRAIATNLLDDDQFTDAHDLVRQAVRLLEDEFDNIVRKAQLVGQSVHADEMSTDATFWQDCGQQWGRGSGYRDRINDRNRGWFDTAHRGAGEP